MAARPALGTFGAGECLPRHRHVPAYAALVLSGGYEECGSRGRFDVGPGDVIVHSGYESHLDRFRQRGARTLDLPWHGAVPQSALGYVRDPDAVVQLAERDPEQASALLRDRFLPVARAASDWPALLADALCEDPGLGLAQWARRQGLAAETVSRGFGKVFGVSPVQFRLEARTHRALAMIMAGAAPFAAIAAATGFADQAHMNRAVRALTGHSPSRLRPTSNAFKTATPSLPTSAG